MRRPKSLKLATSIFWQSGFFYNQTGRYHIAGRSELGPLNIGAEAGICAAAHYTSQKPISPRCGGLFDSPNSDLPAMQAANLQIRHAH